jgi:hypothetical protein
MAKSRILDKELIGYQERQVRTFTETLEVVIKQGQKKANLPTDQDFRSESTKIFGVRAFVNNAAGSAKSFDTATKLLPQAMVQSAVIELFENNTDRVYRSPLETIVGQFNSFVGFANLFMNGYSAKESQIILAEAATEDWAVLIEFTYV